MPKHKPTYTEAITELEKILEEFETNSDVNLEVISEKVKRASELMEFCKKQLHELDKELDKMMGELDD